MEADEAGNQNSALYYFEQLKEGHEIVREAQEKVIEHMWKGEKKDIVRLVALITHFNDGLNYQFFQFAKLDLRKRIVYLMEDWEKRKSELSLDDLESLAKAEFMDESVRTLAQSEVKERKSSVPL